MVFFFAINYQPSTSNRKLIKLMTNEDLLAKIGQTTEETEFYSPMPHRLSQAVS